MPRKNEFKLDVVSVRLVKDAPILSKHRIVTPEDAVDVVGKFLCEMDREVVCVVNLKGDNTPINFHIASIGAVNQAMAHPRELFKSSILSNAANMILLHCHPSGNLHPSKEDTMLTDRMIKLCGLLGIPLLDHIIVGRDNSQYFSFKEKGLLPNPNYLFNTDYRTLDFESPMVAEKGKKR
jgi:DNA repair protein RadC